MNLFSQTAEYALRAVVALAADPPAAKTVQQLTRSTKAPPGYLAKVLQALARAGIVRSQRGLHGGFQLAADPEVLSILDVINAVDPIKRIKGCPLDLPSHRTRLCPLHKRLDEAIASVERAFAQTTLAEVLREPTTSKPLCDRYVQLTGATTA